MLNYEQLVQMQEIEITDIDTSTLVNIENVKTDDSLPDDERLKSYLEQIRNPYCFICGDTPVRVRFVAPEKTLSQSLGNYFMSLK